MACYKIEWKQSAAKELRKLPKPIIGEILNAVAELADNPRPPGSQKLRGSLHAYRIRVRDYRIVYLILYDVLRVEVIKVGHRKNIYRHLP